MDFEEFVTLLGPKLTAAGMPDKFNGTDFDSVFWKVVIIQSLIFLHVRDVIDGRSEPPNAVKQLQPLCCLEGNPASGPTVCPICYHLFSY